MEVPRCSRCVEPKLSPAPTLPPRSRPSVRPSLEVRREHRRPGAAPGESAAPDLGWIGDGDERRVRRQRAPGWIAGVVVRAAAAARKIGVLIDLIDRAVNEYCSIELSTVWNGAASRSMKIVPRTIGSR